MAEVAAIKSVFKEYDHVAVNATKSLIGHGLGAAAGLEAIACIKAIKTGKLHPSLNQDVRASPLANSNPTTRERPLKSRFGELVNSVNGVCRQEFVH